MIGVGVVMQNIMYLKQMSIPKNIVTGFLAVRLHITVALVVMH